jgi:hypothetical protein
MGDVRTGWENSLWTLREAASTLMVMHSANSDTNLIVSCREETTEGCG